MTHPTAPEIRRVLDLLDRQRGMLLSGKLEELPGLTASLERGLERLQAMRLDDTPEARQMVEQLAERARHAMGLAEASRRGLRAATRAVKEGRSGQQLRTYSRDGGTQVLTSARQRDQRS